MPKRQFRVELAQGVLLSIDGVLLCLTRHTPAVDQTGLWSQLEDFVVNFDAVRD